MWKRLIWFLAAVPLAISGQVTADVPPFTADEIAIYRDFLLHYPGPLSQMIGMEDTTVTFTASKAFGDDPHPPILEIPTYSGRQLPPEIMALAQEKAVSARTVAVDRLPDASMKWRFTLSEIAFDSKHELAAFVFSSLQGKGGIRGTVVYELRDGQWKRKKRILNVWQG